MADETIRFILDAIDNASAKFGEVAANFGASSAKMQDSAKGLETQLLAIGVASTAFLALSVKAFVDEESAINKAALATADAAGGFDKAKAAITKLNAEMEAQGFSTEETTAAFTALVTKAGMDVPNALKNTADLLAYSELPNNSLQKSIRALAKEEGEGIIVMEGAAKKRMENADFTLRLAIATEKFGGIMEKIGEKLLPLAEAALAFAGNLMDGFEKLDPAMQDFLLVLGIIAAAIMSVVGAVIGIGMALAPVIGFLGSFGLTWGAVAGAIGTVVSAVGSVIAVIASFATGIGEILLVIAAIIAILLILKLAWDSNFLGMQETLTPFIAWVQNNIGLVLAGIILMPLAPLIALKAMWDTNFFGMRDTADAVIKGVLGFFTNLLTGIVKFGTDGMLAVNKFITDMTAAFAKVITDGLKWGADLVSNILKGIQDKAAEIVAAAAAAASSAAQALLGGASGLAATGVRPLAEGGIITQPTMAILGEGGENEYVIPESKMAAWMGGGRGATNITINVQGANDPEQTARSVFSLLMQELGTSNTDAMVSSKV